MSAAVNWRACRHRSVISAGRVCALRTSDEQRGEQRRSACNVFAACLRITVTQAPV